MAWRSSGTNNDEMVSNLKRFGVISSPAVEEGFRAVDRRFFVPRTMRHMAHTDQPLREGNVHISAPHMYGTVVEALDLVPSSCASFLNIGSGTGYLSCIVAHIMGPASTHYAVDIQEDVLEHSRRAIQEWRDARMGQDDDGRELAQTEVLHGNGLSISTEHGEGVVGLDRIYIGAAVGKQYLNQLAELLKPGGILVGPVEDELVKIHRIGRTSSVRVNPMPRILRGQPPPLSADFTLEVVSNVRFFPLSEHPEIPVTLPTRVWGPERHALYPESFRKATKQILMCSRSDEVQPVKLAQRQNVACKLPGFIWMEILSYTRRDWFEKPVPEETMLKKRLREEQTRSESRQERIQVLEARVRQVEREREMYRILSVRLQRRVDARDRTGSTRASERNATVRVDATASGAMAGDGPLLVRLLGLGSGSRAAAIRHADEVEDTDSDDEVNDDESNEEMDNYSVMSTESEVLREAMEETHMARPQVRSVSISTND